jgi:Ni2+-binding GTPase involved in maturation of urease and hydrogenase
MLLRPLSAVQGGQVRDRALRITISGEVASGKTHVARYIWWQLRQHGFDCVIKDDGDDARTPTALSETIAALDTIGLQTAVMIVTDRTAKKP